MSVAMADKISSFAELRALIRTSLRVQNPQWVEPNGESPICDEYEARLANLLHLIEAQNGSGSTKCEPAPAQSRRSELAV
jgi:hypothetical protein